MMNPKEIDEIIEIFKSRLSHVDTLPDGKHSHIREGYIQSDDKAFDITSDRASFSKEDLSFLEIGCGFGNNTLRAGLLGYDAKGVDIREDYVDAGNRVIDELKAEDAIDKSVRARLFYGNFMDKNTIRWYKKKWAKEASRILWKGQAKVEEMMARFSASELDVLTESEFHMLMGDTKYIPLKKLELKPSEVLRLEGINEKEIDTFTRVSPKIILANPYEPEGRDVYDAIGKSFSDFDVYYIWPWGPEYLPLYKMLYEDHPAPFKLYDHKVIQLMKVGMHDLAGFGIGIERGKLEYDQLKSRKFQIIPDRIFTQNW